MELNRHDLLMAHARLLTCEELVARRFTGSASTSYQLGMLAALHNALVGEAILIGNKMDSRQSIEEYLWG